MADKPGALSWRLLLRFIEEGEVAQVVYIVLYGVHS